MEKKKARILVIDDEELVLDSVVLAMERLDYEVDAALNRMEAFELLGNKSYDLVIADIRLPDDKSGGMEILKKVKAENPDTEVILMTGFGTIEQAVEAMRLGAFDYVEKGSGLLIPTLEEKVQNVIKSENQ